jgi:hypothetical protein
MRICNKRFPLRSVCACTCDLTTVLNKVIINLYCLVKTTQKTWVNIYMHHCSRSSLAWRGGRPREIVGALRWTPKITYIKCSPTYFYRNEYIDFSLKMQFNIFLATYIVGNFGKKCRSKKVLSTPCPCFCWNIQKSFKSRLSTSLSFLANVVTV